MKKKSENTKQYSLFKHETEVLEQINAVIKEQQDGNEQNPLLKDLQYMQRNYNKMFRNLKILTRLNDQQQSDLTSAKSKTEKLLNIQQTVTNIIQISLKPIAFKQQLSFILDEILSNQSFKLQGSGCIFLADQEDSTVFKMAVHKGIEDDIVLACSSIKSGVCLCGQSAKEKRFIFKNCVDDDHTIQSKYKKQHGHYIVPIVSGSNVLGILNLYLNEGHEENSNEQDFLWAVASTLAGVIERNQTEEELEASRKKLVALVDQLKEARNQAVIANETKSLFLANMSHEIRTPLTAILGFADTLLDEGLKKESRKLVTIILNNGNHLLTLVNDILDLSKIEANKLDIEKIPMDPCFLAKEIEMLLVGFAVKKGLTFKLEFKFPFPRQINSDPTRLKQIIINLCNNAIKFTEKGSIQLIVAYDAEKNVLNFSVIDSGIGLTADQQQRIFSAFEQADSSTTRKYGGTGLGLHVSLRLAEMLGGGIDVESVYGQGSCFNICVDAGEIASQQLIHHLDDMESTVIIKPSKLSIPMLKGHVLLAEDGIDNQKLIALLLEKVGLTVDVAENGQVAVEKVSTNSYDLVLMDMHMPVMDGIEATKQIVANNYDKPVIALTGGVTEDNINTLKNAGCRDILAKPIEKKKFYDVLKTYLKNVEKDSINHQKTPADKKLSGHVLVVEDNQQNLDLIAIFLKKLNLTHESAENGQIGVDKALSGDFDLVLMDMQMPIMSGVEATRILRQANYPKPIVACTANVSKSDLETYEKIGCDSLIAKPIIRKKFTKIIEDLLQNKPVDTDAINTVLRPDLSARLLVCDHRKRRDGGHDR